MNQELLAELREEISATYIFAFKCNEFNYTLGLVFDGRMSFGTFRLFAPLTYLAYGPMLRTLTEAKVSITAELHRSFFSEYNPILIKSHNVSAKPDIYLVYFLLKNA